jgi:glycerophosphoryl diester phosphodiesterase
MSRRPVVIAHRGACAYLPEHSRGAKSLAYAMGADYLEQDVIATRDGQLVILHDLQLDAVSDVRARFPGREREDGRFYCFDFDLDELRQLRFHERVDPVTGAQRYPGRYPATAGAFRVSTLDEEIGFVDAMNRSTGREVGIYPEIKEPAWHRAQGFDLGAAIIDTLERQGYLKPGRKIFLQCFEPESLAAARSRVGPDLPMIQLISSRTEVTSELLAQIATYATGIGPSLRLIYRGRNEHGEYDLSRLVPDAQALGLAVHPYTFRADDLPGGIETFQELLELFIITYSSDGVFTDFTDLVSAFLDGSQSFPQ